MSEIPDDIREAARRCIASYWQPDNQVGLDDAIAAALLAEREAQKERDAKIADCGCDNPFCELDELARAIRQQKR
jgi:hypothetical protein